MLSRNDWSFKQRLHKSVIWSMFVGRSFIDKVIDALVDTIHSNRDDDNVDDNGNNGDDDINDDDRDDGDDDINDNDGNDGDGDINDDDDNVENNGDDDDAYGDVHVGDIGDDKHSELQKEGSGRPGEETNIELCGEPGFEVGLNYHWNSHKVKMKFHLNILVSILY